MSRYNRVKGRDFEKKVAKIIHKFLLENYEEYRKFVEDVNDIKVKRDVNSGVSLNSKGDIDLGIGIKYFPFSVECKKRNDLSITLKNLFKLEKSKLNTIYRKQSKRKSKQHNLYPLVVFSQNYTDIFVFFHLDDMPFDHILLYDYSLLKCDNYIVMKFIDFLEVWKKWNLLKK